MSDAELERFKTGVNLSEFAAAQGHVPRPPRKHPCLPRVFLWRSKKTEGV